MLPTWMWRGMLWGFFRVLGSWGGVLPDALLLVALDDGGISEWTSWRTSNGIELVAAASGSESDTTGVNASIGGALPEDVHGFEVISARFCGNWEDLLLTKENAVPMVDSVQACAGLCSNNSRCLQFNFQPEAAGSKPCPHQRGAGSCYLYKERVQPVKCNSQPNPCWDLYTWQNPWASRHLEVTCPAIGALMRNGDLVPDENGRIFKEQTREAFLRVGISPFTANITVEFNFQSDACPACTPSVDPTKMNVIVPGVTHNPRGPQEHFRSTGVRDIPVNVTRFDLAASICLSTGPLEWNLERNTCISETFDCDGPTCEDGPHGPRFPSNDIAEDKRPDTCPFGTSGQDKCPSALFGTINLLFQEFASPTGEKALISNTEYRALWVEGVYPKGFAARSPRHCVQEGEATDSHFGCAKCLAEVDQGVEDTKQRYCRCMISKRLSNSIKDTIPAWTSWCMPNGVELVVAATGSESDREPLVVETTVVDTGS